MSGAFPFASFPVRIFCAAPSSQTCFPSISSDWKGAETRLRPAPRAGQSRMLNTTSIVQGRVWKCRAHACVAATMGARFVHKALLENRNQSGTNPLTTPLPFRTGLLSEPKYGATMSKDEIPPLTLGNESFIASKPFVITWPTRHRSGVEFDTLDGMRD